MIVPIMFLLVALFYLLILMWYSIVDATYLLGTSDNVFAVLSSLIDIVDLSLLCVIILIIMWWIYEIFIQRLLVSSEDQNRADEILIHDIDELKQKLGKVIIVSLVVHIFKQLLVFEFTTSLDLLRVGIVILLLAGSLFLVEKMGSNSYTSNKIPLSRDAHPPLQDDVNTK